MTPIQHGRMLESLVKYKIHGINSVSGAGRSANNNVFYDTYEAAYEKCLQYMRSSNSPDNGFVIMKTCAIVKHNEPPVSTYVVRDSGQIKEI